jgi:hypothetical protein
MEEGGRTRPARPHGGNDWLEGREGVRAGVVTAEPLRLLD